MAAVDSWRQSVEPPDNIEDLIDRARLANEASVDAARKLNAVGSGKYRQQPARKGVIPDSDDEDDDDEDPNADTPQDSTADSSIVLVSESQPITSRRVKQTTSRQEEQRFYHRATTSANPPAGAAQIPRQQANLLPYPVYNRVKQTSRAEQYAKQPAKQPLQTPPPKVIEIDDTPPSPAELQQRSNSQSSSRLDASSSSGISFRQKPVDRLSAFKRVAPQPNSSQASTSTHGASIHHRDTSSAASKPSKANPATPIYDVSSASSTSLPDPWAKQTGPSLRSPKQQRYAYGQFKQDIKPFLTAKQRVTAEFNEENRRKGIPIGKPTDPTKGLPGWSQRKRAVPPICIQASSDFPDRSTGGQDERKYTGRYKSYTGPLIPDRRPEGDQEAHCRFRGQSRGFRTRPAARRAGHQAASTSNAWGELDA